MSVPPPEAGLTGMPAVLSGSLSELRTFFVLKHDETR